MVDPLVLFVFAPLVVHSRVPLFSITFYCIGGMYGGHLYLKKFAQPQNSERHVDFWPVRRLGSSWNFKVFQCINVNESFKHYCTHHKLIL